jgi:hypothetical protein
MPFQNALKKNYSTPFLESYLARWIDPKVVYLTPVAVMHRNYVDNNPLNYRTVYCATILWLRRSQT